MEQRLDALKGLYNKAMDDVFHYSGNYLMSYPRKGYEKEWERAKTEAGVLTELIRETEIVIKATCGVSPFCILNGAGR